MNWNQLTTAEENFFEKYFVEVQGNVNLIRRDFLLQPTSLSPYQVFKILKEEFGSPNGMFDETKSQWTFLLQSPDTYYQIYDWKLFSWSICVYLKKDVTKSAEVLANQLLKQFESRAKKYNSEINAKSKNPDGLIIVNPFKTYRDSADSLFELINDLKEPKQGNASTLKYSRSQRIYDLSRSAFIMYFSSVECFINLIYELYIRKDLREQRIYDHIRREPIDLKLRLAPIYCECFGENKVDPGNTAVKQFSSIVNLRNDFIHGNFTKPMMKPIVYEDDIEFVVDIDSTTSVGIPNNFSEIDSHHVEKIKSITQNLIDYTLSLMNRRIKKEFKYCMYIYYIRVEFDNGQLYIQ